MKMVQSLRNNTRGLKAQNNVHREDSIISEQITHCKEGLNIPFQEIKSSRHPRSTLQNTNSQQNIGHRSQGYTTDKHMQEVHQKTL